jgi:hypothetical protein
MKLLTTIVASAALVGFAAVQSPQVFAQAANAQIGASTSQGGAGGQGRGSVNMSGRGSATTGQSVGGRADIGGRSGVKSETTRTRVGVRSGGETTIRGRSQVRVGVSSGGREDIVLRRKRAHGVVVYNDEPERRLIIKKRRHPSVAIVGEESRSVVRSRGGGDINVRTSVRSRATTSGSATTVNRSQSSASGTSRAGARTQSGGQANQSGGKAGNAPGGNARSTTGQGPSR